MCVCERQELRTLLMSKEKNKLKKEAEKEFRKLPKKEQERKIHHFIRIKEQNNQTREIEFRRSWKKEQSNAIFLNNRMYPDGIGRGRV